MPIIGLAEDNLSLSWIDLPRGKIESYLNIDDESVLSVANHMFEEYHQIKKDQISNLPERIMKLQQIAKELNSHLEKSVAAKLAPFKHLANTATKKANYLQALKNIYDTEGHKYQNMYTYHLGSINISDEYYPLYLVNKLLYDAKVPTFWGYYWLETIDPCHRQLTDYYLKWLEASSNVPFFMWLEKQDIPYYIPSIYYYTASELSRLEVRIKKGLLYDNNGRLLTLKPTNTAYLFALSLDKRLYIAEGSLKIRHTSITHGKPVLASGEIKVEKGKIIYWSTESGHYQPTANHAYQTAKLFRELNLQLNPECTAMYYTFSGKNNVACSLVHSVLSNPAQTSDNQDFSILSNLL